MSETMTGNTYLARFEAEEPRWGSNGSSWALPLRRKGIETFGRLGIPSRKHEEWKYTNVQGLAQLDLRHAEAAPEVSAQEIAQLVGAIDAARGETPLIRIVLVDGRLSANGSDLHALPEGVLVQPLATAIARDRKAVESRLAALSGEVEHPFVSLNTAFFQDGAYVHVRRGVDLAAPIHLLHVSTGRTGATAAHPRTLVVAEENSRLRLIEDYASLGAGTFLTNPVTELFVGPNARIDHYKIVREGEGVFHLAGTFGHLERDGRLQTHNLSRGGRVVRNDLRVDLRGPGAECTLNGLNVASGDQLMDDHTAIVHAVPHCASREYYKSILDGRSQGVFNGKVFVYKDAQKTDGVQSNNALILSPKALMNTKPQLEIFADDVKCTHGATIGQLDADALFYLRSRGMDAERARGMLVHAFAADVIDRMDFEPVRLLAMRVLDEALAR